MAKRTTAEWQSFYLKAIDDYLADGDRRSDAFERLYVNLLPIIKLVLNKMNLFDEHRLEDVASEVLINKLIPNLEKYSAQKGNFTTWVRQATKNFAIDQIRKAENYSVHEADMDMREADPISRGFLSIDDIQVVKSHVPFRIQDPALEAIGDTFLRTQGRVAGTTMHVVGEVLDEHGVAWRRYGKISEITSFLFALIRMAKVTPEDTERVYLALHHVKPTTPLGLIRLLMGPQAAVTMVLLFGGSALRLPLPAALTALTPPRRVLTSRSA